MRKFIFTVAILMTINSAHAAKKDFDADHMKVPEKAIADAIEKKVTPGAVLVAGRGDGVVYEKAFGHFTYEDDAPPVKVDTIYDLASLSKSVGCASSVMVLLDKGKISVSDPVIKYLPEFDNNEKSTMTVEQLLLHRTGLVADNPLGDYKNGVEESWKKLMEQKLKNPPGEKFLYSDVNFLVLGRLVEKVSGQTLDKFAHENVFEPLGMKDTFYLAPENLKPRIAPTTKDPAGTVHDPRAAALGGVAGHAGVFGTAGDVARFCRMLLNGGEVDGKRVLSETTVKEMTTPRAMPDGTSARGYGVDFTSGISGGPRGERFEKGTTYGHTGYTGTMYWIDPKNDCFVVLLTNRVYPDDKQSVSALRRAVSTAVAEAFLGPAK